MLTTNTAGEIVYGSTGIKEEPGEQMDSIAKRLSTEIKVDIDLKDIDSMYRLGRQTFKTSSTGPSTANMQLNSRPRDIIIKFTTCHARQAVFTHRAELKHSLRACSLMKNIVVKCITMQYVW